MRRIVPWVLVGCGRGAPTAPDLDRDGVADVVDCDDRDPSTFREAPELADGRDNDCNSFVDDLTLSEVASTRFSRGSWPHTFDGVGVSDLTGDGGAELVLALPCSAAGCLGALVAISALPAGDADPFDHASVVVWGLPAALGPMVVHTGGVVLGLPELVSPGEPEECRAGAIVSLAAPWGPQTYFGRAPMLVGNRCGAGTGSAIAVGRFEAAGASVAVWSPGTSTLTLAELPQSGVGSLEGASTAEILVPSGVRSLLASDLDADGRDDLLLERLQDGWAIASDPQDTLVADDLYALGGSCPSDGPSPRVGDLDGDGTTDLVLACNAVTIATGPFLHDRHVTGAVPRIELHERLYDGGMAVGDGDGDGIDDLALADESGTATLYFGPLDGVLDAEDDASATIRGDSYRDDIGRQLVFGDLDTDGRAELLVGSDPMASDRLSEGVILSVVPGFDR